MKKILSRITLISLLIFLSNCQQNVNLRFEGTPTPSPTPIITPSSTTTPAPYPTPVITPTPEIVKVTSSPTTIVTIISPTPTPIPTPVVKSNIILFDTSKNPFGNSQQTNINNLSKLNDLLKTKYTILFDNFNNVTNLDNIDTILIFSPSGDYSVDEIKKLSNFVKSGKKVVITGEWGGYGQFSSTSVNQFLKQANLEINEDVIKEYNSINYDLNDEQLIIKNFATHTITEQISKLALYSSSSVDIIDGKINVLDNTKTKFIAFSGDQSFRIQSTVTNPGVAAISNIGDGKVIVIGDSSEFTNNDTNSNGKINLDEADNKQFILNILSW